MEILRDIRTGLSFRCSSAAGGDRHSGQEMAVVQFSNGSAKRAGSGLHGRDTLKAMIAQPGWCQTRRNRKFVRRSLPTNPLEERRRECPCQRGRVGRTARPDRPYRRGLIFRARQPPRGLARRFGAVIIIARGPPAPGFAPACRRASSPGDPCRSRLEGVHYGMCSCEKRETHPSLSMRP